jgi:hypothetical protein
MNIAYFMGQSDYSAGKSMAHNRFQVGTSSHDAWRQGWIDAEYTDPHYSEAERASLTALEKSE